VIKGKQIQSNSITQSKLNLTTLSATTALATVEYVNLSGGTKKTWSMNNYSMSASITLSNGDLACVTPIIDKPYSTVSVKINGLEVSVGGVSAMYDAYFSPDSGTTIRAIGEEKQGDYLYWNTTNAGYNLDNNDIIDFIYLTKVFETYTLELVFETNQSSNQTVILKLK
jgi:hypothetical protein